MVIRYRVTRTNYTNMIDVWSCTQGEDLQSRNNRLDKVWKGCLSRYSPMMLTVPNRRAPETSARAAMTARCLHHNLLFLPLLFPAGFCFLHCSGPQDSMYHFCVSAFEHLITSGSQALCLQLPEGQTLNEHLSVMSTKHKLTGTASSQYSASLMGHQ